ncbi:MAG: AraC family transcriptional regulator [Clostridia bacterium]|nr:AraC family transcriptional regulator [Clostridia bacterium]
MTVYSKCEIKRTVQIDAIVSFFNEVFEYDHYFSGETHNFWEIVCVLSGKVGVTANKDVYLLESGTAIVHEPMEFHSIWSEKGTAPEIVILSFYAKSMPDLSGRLCQLSEETAEELRTLVGDAHQIFTYGDEREIEPTEIIPGKESDASLLVTRIECTLHKLLATQNEGFIHQSQSAKNYRFILSVLEKNLYKKLTVTDIAVLCNMSESNLKKIFYKFAGCGIMHYFNSMKVKKAAEFIGNGLSVKEAADRLGFTDQNYFSTVFKRITGVSPAKYK